jgi:hypothetical protein
MASRKKKKRRREPRKRESTNKTATKAPRSRPPDNAGRSRFEITHLVIAVVALVLGALLAIFAAPLYSHFFDTASVERETIGGATAQLLQDPDPSDGSTTNALAVPYLVLNNAGGEERAVVELRPITETPEGTPLFEDYEPTTFWTTDSCESASFALEADRPRVVALPEIAKDWQTRGVIAVGEISGVFVRLNDGDIILVSVPNDEGMFEGFHEEMRSIALKCLYVLSGG